MAMGLQKKRTVTILTLCMAICFILYQVYFYIKITESDKRKSTIKLFDYHEVKEFAHQRSEHDKFISSEGMLKGVLLSHMPKYRPDWKNKFKCLKSEQKIPFEFVNDDFCDCDDGTDEPSTSACTNGIFFCETQHHKKTVENQVPSSQVNDGICDCCDGSDEWLSKKLVSQSNSNHYRYYVPKCPNTCKL